MTLSIQIQSFIVSFFYGFLVSYLINLCYRFLFLSKKTFQIIFTFFLSFSICLFYFFILYIINGGVVHLYFLILVLLGTLIGNLFSRKARRLFLKKDSKE